MMGNLLIKFKNNENLMKTNFIITIISILYLLIKINTN